MATISRSATTFMGSKLWAENELLKRTTYAYDAYNRLISVADPLQDTTTYNYSPTQGNPYLHTTDSAYFVTNPVDRYGKQLRSELSQDFNHPGLRYVIRSDNFVPIRLCRQSTKSD